MSSRSRCDFGISVTYSHQSRLLKVDQVRKNHSSACMAANGNMSTRKKQRSSATGSRSAAARKTGSGITSQPSWLDLVQATESLQSGHTWQVDSVVPLNDIDDTEVSPQAESSSAAQRRTSNAAPAISTADKGKKRGRDNETLPSRSSSSRSTKNARKPSKPRVDGTYNSVHHFIQAVKAYSHSTSPNAELRQSDNLVGKSGSKSKKKVGAVTLQCTFPDCPFYATAKGLQDDRGRELEGFQIKSVSLVLLLWETVIGTERNYRWLRSIALNAVTTSMW